MNLACNVHIETLTQITKDQAERLINLTENNRGVILCLDPFVSGEVKMVTHCKIQITSILNQKHQLEVFYGKSPKDIKKSR